MTTINDAYINALLADASYVNNLLPNQTGANLAVLLAKRMTDRKSTRLNSSHVD